jgi:hypothetical protein
VTLVADTGDSGLLGYLAMLDWYIVTDILKEFIVSIFRVKQSESPENFTVRQHCCEILKFAHLVQHCEITSSSF